MFAVILVFKTSNNQLRRALAGVIFCPSRALGLFRGRKRTPEMVLEGFRVAPRGLRDQEKSSKRRSRERKK